MCAGLAAAAVLEGPVGGNSNVTGALVTAPVLLWLTWLIARRLALRDGNPVVVPVLMGGFCLKIIGVMVRYHVAAKVYGTGDFFDYDKWGARIAAGLREGHMITLPGRFAGTNFIRIFTGVIYAVSPSSLMSGFLVYGWLSFIGLVFFWRAYRIAISTRRDMVYLTWLVVLPSLLYWPSSIGKDAYMVLAMGITAYGAACILVNRLTPGLVALSIGFVGMCLVRPHIALVACGGLLLASLVRRNRGGAGRRILGLIFVVVAAVVVVQVSSTFFGIQTFNRTSIQRQITDTSKSTGEGGSEFKPVIVTSPLKFPAAAATVLYRPLPFETHSFQETLTAIECAMLALLTIAFLPRIWRALRRSRDYPYLMFCVGALLVFIIAFSGFSNFGLLARQRAVVQPLLLVFLTLPADIDKALPRARDREDSGTPPSPREGSTR